MNMDVGKVAAAVAGLAALVALALWALLPSSVEEAASPPEPAAATEPQPTDDAASRARALSAAPVQEPRATLEPPTVAAERESEAPPPATRDTGTPIAWVRRGESVELLSSPGGERVARVGDETEFGSPTVFAVFRREGRWLGVPTPQLPNGELGWIRLDDGRLGMSRIDQRVVVDLSERQARLLRDGRTERSWAVTVGAEGSETPTGRFAVTDTFSGGLNPAYGCCAVALTATQPDLPSGWLGGNRIAFHGTAGPLGVAASHGCIRSADDDVRYLLETVPLGTPVRVVG